MDRRESFAASEFTTVRRWVSARVFGTKATRAPLRARLAARQAAWESLTTHPQKWNTKVERTCTLLRGLIVASLIISQARAFQPGKRYVLLRTSRQSNRKSHYFAGRPGITYGRLVDDCAPVSSRAGRILAVSPGENSSWDACTTECVGAGGVLERANAP